MKQLGAELPVLLPKALRHRILSLTWRLTPRVPTSCRFKMGKFGVGSHHYFLHHHPAIADMVECTRTCLCINSCV